MQKKSAVSLLLIMLLAACSSSAPPPPRPDFSSTDASLAEASYAVSRSMSSLSEIAQAAHPLPKLAPPPNPASYDMAQLTSVDWSGPVEPLALQLAKTAHYRLRVLGRPPAIPILVTVYSQNMMLADILRDIGYQCGRRAEIVVFPESKVVELRYAKN